MGNKTINGKNTKGVIYPITGNVYHLHFYDDVKLKVLVNEQGGVLHLTDYASGLRIATLARNLTLHTEREQATNALNRVINVNGIKRVKGVIYDATSIN